MYIFSIATIICGKLFTIFLCHHLFFPGVEMRGPIHEMAGNNQQREPVPFALISCQEKVVDSVALPRDDDVTHDGSLHFFACACRRWAK